MPARPLLRRIVPDPLILLLIATVALATILPARGQFSALVDHLATAAVVLLFFFHGAKLPRSAVIGGLAHWRLHGLVLACTFVLFPIVGMALALLLPGLLPPLLWTGMLFLFALPSTVQSSVVFTSIARGNVPAAIASASASQLVGIAVTPLFVTLLAGAHGAPVRLSGILSILLELMLPFVAGHMLRPWIGAWVDRHKPLIAITDRGAIMISVYSAFSGAVIAGIWSRLPPSVLVALLLACALILAIMLLLTRTIARSIGFPREDEAVVVFCGTKKSIIQGVPMARVLFPGPDMGMILLPLMVFHQIQLIACAVIARRYARQAAAEACETGGGSPI